MKYSVEIPTIKITLEKQHNQVVFKISNVAKAIPSMYLNRLFEKFFRVPTGNLHQVKGYGLGLSYVSYIVGQHKGYIGVISDSDLITFTLTLPVDDFA
ncbi:MAG: GHKL domain-containing protein [Flavobacterium sp.]|nr:MAG: GHKL domain-containing protein [Flavobacterium sp.]